MGWAIVDYFFRCDPFEFNFHLLVLCGYWPLQTKNKFWQAVFSVFSFLCFFSIISMLFIQILDLYLLRNEPIKFTKNMCATTVTIGSIVKYLLVFHEIEKVEIIHGRLRGFFTSLTDPYDQRLAEKATKQIKQTTKAFYGLAIPCIITWMLYPGLEGRDDKSVPFPYRLPTNDWSTPIYEILYIYQSLSMVGFMVIILSNDLNFYGMVIQVNAKYEMLIKKINDIEAMVAVNNNNEEEDETRAVSTLYDSAETERIRGKVKECALFHQDILEEITVLKSIYSSSIFAHFVTAVVVVGVLIIDVIMISKGIQLQMLQRLAYVANGVFDTFLFCFFTTEMEEKSFEVQLAVYSTSWHQFSPKLRQELFLIMTRAKKPARILAGNYVPLNLSTFLSFLKLTYNITALLYQTVKN